MNYGLFLISSDWQVSPVC